MRFELRGRAIRVALDVSDDELARRIDQDRGKLGERLGRAGLDLEAVTVTRAEFPDGRAPRIEARTDSAIARQASGGELAGGDASGGRDEPRAPAPPLRPASRGGAEGPPNAIDGSGARRGGPLYL
ncbi:hypothetical protein [Propylenella binzhouense]|uniref:hypothetical protein n=1 Tax=Propylenella binzhouense TaxID=2555902 RepID=UPI003CCCB934